ncbi:MAG: [protein-PII] uridylyltransferase [Polyangiaceae bacterium]
MVGALGKTGTSWKDRLAALRSDLDRVMASGTDGGSLGRAHARGLDAILVELFEEARRRDPEARDAFALGAVGSYGRGAVARCSDADVRLVASPDVAQDAAIAFAEAMLYPLWDAGFSIGHQVVTADDYLALAATDLATATSILDMRLVAGHAGILADLLDRAFRGLFDESGLEAFVGRLEAEATARHGRFGGSVYLLEPDVKSGAGALRDLDGARWAARARFRVAEPSTSDATPSAWSELVRVGALVPREAHEIIQAEEFLWRVRNRLHVHAGRRSDRLSFDEQEAVSVELGYARGAENPADPDARAARAERFMQDYYLHARTITRARAGMLERATPPKRRGKRPEVDLGRGVRSFDGQITIAGKDELLADPALALRVYAAALRHDAPVLPFARESIARASADPTFAESLRGNAEAAEAFVELVATVAETKTKNGSMVGELHDVGILLAMIPEFRPVMGRVHHDVYHVYTVDVHSVAAVDRLRAIARGDLAHDYPLASRLAAETAQPRTLFLATLLHDVGKGYPDASGSRKNHSQSGAELCERILPRLGLGADDVRSVRALVQQHLAMYHVATRRDLDDPATIEEFSRLVEDREGLRNLYLLTVADISTTSPTAMTTWKARMLDELYFATDAHLAGKSEEGRRDERIARLLGATRAAWQGPPEFLEAFVASMPDRYLLANAPEAIVAHAGAALDRGDAKVHVALAPSRHAEVTELCVVAEDTPGLLARIAAALTANRLEVLGAEVYSRTGATKDGVRREEAVDLFWVRDRIDAERGVAGNMPRLSKDLSDVCEKRVDPAELLRARVGGGSQWRERPSPPVPTEVVIDDRASPRHTVVEVFAKDRPGLLHRLATALHELGLSIVLSKINTEGAKVADVFYVHELDGSKVAPGDRHKTIRETLLRAASESS